MTLKAIDAHRAARIWPRQVGRELIIGYPWHYTEATRRAREVLQSGQPRSQSSTCPCLFAAPIIEFFRANDQAYMPIFQYPVTGPGSVYADPKVSGGGQGYLQVTHSVAIVLLSAGWSRTVSRPSWRTGMCRSTWSMPSPCAASRQAAMTAWRVLGSTGNMCAPCGTHFEVRIYCENGHIVVDEATGTLFVRGHDNTEEIFGPLPAEETYPRFAPPNNLVDIILGRGENRSPASIGVTVGRDVGCGLPLGGGGRPAGQRGRMLAQRPAERGHDRWNSAARDGPSRSVRWKRPPASVARSGLGPWTGAPIPVGTSIATAILGDAGPELRRLQATGLQVSNLYWTFGNGFVDRALNSPDAAVRRQNLEDFKPRRRLLPSGAGPIGHDPARYLHPARDDRSRGPGAVHGSLPDLLAISRPAGVAMALEPHVGGLLESPHDRPCGWSPRHRAPGSRWTTGIS